MLSTMRAKLLKLQLANEEQQERHAEELAQQEARHRIELSVVGDTFREVEAAHEALMKATSVSEAVVRERIASLEKEKEAAVGAEAKVQASLATLQQQVGGGNWLQAVSNAKGKAATAQQATKDLQRKLDELNDVLAVGQVLRAKGGKLLAQCETAAGARAAGLQPQLAADLPMSAADVGLTERRVDQLAAHLEKQLFHAGAGQVPRTQLLLSALLKRPAVQRVLNRKETHFEKLNRVARQMVDSAAGVLGHLTTGKRGSRSAADHERFEAIVAALTPDDAEALYLISTIGELLGIHHEQVERALVSAATLPCSRSISCIEPRS
jgi:hypothetical protein